MFQLVSCSFSTIPICPFLIQRIFPFTCIIGIVEKVQETSSDTGLHNRAITVLCVNSAAMLCLRLIFTTCSVCNY